MTDSGLPSTALSQSVIEGSQILDGSQDLFANYNDTTVSIDELPRRTRNSQKSVPAGKDARDTEEEQPPAEPPQDAGQGGSGSGGGASGSGGGASGSGGGASGSGGNNGDEDDPDKDKGKRKGRKRKSNVSYPAKIPIVPRPNTHLLLLLGN